MCSHWACPKYLEKHNPHRAQITDKYPWWSINSKVFFCYQRSPFLHQLSDPLGFGGPFPLTCVHYVQFSSLEAPIVKHSGGLCLTGEELHPLDRSIVLHDRDIKGQPHSFKSTKKFWTLSSCWNRFRRPKPILHNGIQRHARPYSQQSSKDQYLRSMTRLLTATRFVHWSEPSRNWYTLSKAATCTYKNTDRLPSVLQMS